jgi:hippurate hydrolase
LKVDTGIGGHGVVGVLSNEDGPTVLLRAELDALPVAERTGLEYASTVSEAMHACGHDLHMAAAAGAAAYLSGERDRWRGTLLVIGQPAEETSRGAAAMLADGLYERFGVPDAVMAQHTAPLPAGMLAHGAGPITAGSIALDVTIIGRGGHPATPHLCLDPVVIAATVVTRLQAIAAQHVGAGTLTVGTLRAGSHVGVIADEAHLGLTLRALSEPVFQEMHDSVVRAIHSGCESAGTPQPPTIRQAARTPVNYTDADLTGRVRTAHEEAFGADRVAWWPPSLATEDFPLLGIGRIPTVYWMLGVVGPQQWRAAGRTAAEKFAALPTNHSNTFTPWPRLALPHGIQAMAVAALSVMAF